MKSIFSFAFASVHFVNFNHWISTFRQFWNWKQKEREKHGLFSSFCIFISTWLIFKTEDTNSPWIVREFSISSASNSITLQSGFVFRLSENWIYEIGHFQYARLSSSFRFVRSSFTECASLFFRDGRKEWKMQTIALFMSQTSRLVVNFSSKKKSERRKNWKSWMWTM